MSDFVTGANPAIPVLNPPPPPPPLQAGRMEKPGGMLHASTRFTLNHPLSGDHFTPSANAPGPDKIVENKKADPLKPGEKPDEKGKVSATSRMVGRFKVGYAIVGSSVLNTFLFGTPLWVSGGLAAAFAGLQAAIATKIERGDTPVAKKMLQGAKKIVGAKDTSEGNTRQGRVMAMVWGGVAGTLSLAEACLNDVYRAVQKSRGIIEPTTEQLIQGFQAKIREGGWLKRIHQLQLQGVQFRTQLEKGIGLSGWKKTLSAIWNFTRQRAKGNRWLGYGAAIGAAFVGACIQTGMADILQKRLIHHKAKSNPNDNGQK